MKKAWYVGPGVETERIAKWELRHQLGATLDPRAEFAAVLRKIGGIVEGEHPSSTGKGIVWRRQKINAEKQRSFTAPTWTEYRTAMRKTIGLKK